MTSELKELHQNYPNYLTFTSELPILPQMYSVVTLTVASKLLQLPRVTLDLPQHYCRKTQRHHKITRELAVTPELPCNYHPRYLRVISELPHTYFWITAKLPRFHQNDRKLQQRYIRIIGATTLTQITSEWTQNYPNVLAFTSKLPQNDHRMS